MKKIVLLLILAMAFTTATEAQTRKKSGSGKKKSSSAAVLPVTKGETKQYGDYLTTQLFTVKKGKDNKVEIEYPISGDPVLVNAIRKKIKDSVNDKFTGSLDTPDALMRSALKGKKDVKFGQEGESLSQEIKVVYSSPEVITFTDNGYWYGGGAHGMPWSTGKTFLVADGSILTSDMLPSFSKMKPYIRKGFAKSYGVRESEVGDYLFDSNGPDDYSGTVFVTDQGLVIIYQPYEISPYSSGAPTAVIPLAEEIINLFPAKGKRFIK